MDNTGSLFFDKDKHSDESCAHIEDAEAEAEAAASAVAVAAISNNDELVGNRLGICSIPESKSFSSADNTELKGTTGIAQNFTLDIKILFHVVCICCF